jgi:hypothetical protein
MDMHLDIALSESSNGAFWGITARSEQAKELVSKYATQPLRRVNDTLWMESTAAKPLLNEAAQRRLAIGWSSGPN